jgi:hypothetical protein
MNYFWYAISFKDSKELRETTNWHSLLILLRSFFKFHIDKVRGKHFDTIDNDVNKLLRIQQGKDAYQAYKLNLPILWYREAKSIENGKAAQKWREESAKAKKREAAKKTEEVVFEQDKAELDIINRYKAMEQSITEEEAELRKKYVDEADKLWVTLTEEDLLELLSTDKKTEEVNL